MNNVNRADFALRELRETIAAKGRRLELVRRGDEIIAEVYAPALSAVCRHAYRVPVPFDASLFAIRVEEMFRVDPKERL